ncbi:MAG: UvrD-helicase domain-containing protein, partial [Planctomycetota bacterium]
MGDEAGRQYAGMPLTETQHAAVTGHGSNLLVSAAAGSGKTRVLAARAVHLMADAPVPCSASELLVVTFTRKAAAEMRGRIADVLERRIAQASGDEATRLRRQQVLLGRAQIGTVHSFCQNLLRRHFQLLELDPAFTVLEPEAAHLLRRRVMRDVTDRWFTEPRGKFFELIDGYG